MTPKDKAIGLYCKYIDAYNDRNLQVSDYKFAKQCALIAVDEIIEALENNAANSASWLYYEEVKQEMEAL